MSVNTRHAPDRSVLITLTLALAVIAALGIRQEASAAEPFGTFSIVARDSITGELGVAVHSRAFSVGAGVSWAEAGVGAIATQASTNESFGPRGLDLLRAGLSATEALDHLIAHDPNAENRQLAIVDAAGHVAVHTGSSCLDWAGHATGASVSCQGNILTGEEVVAAMREAFITTEGELARKLLAALVAGQDAGGDKRGVQSAAILVVRDSEMFPEYRTRYVDLRVEDHVDPIHEIVRVFDYHESTDLVRAHLRFATAYDASGDTRMAILERMRVGQALDKALARGESDPNLLNGLAWYTASANVYLDQALEAAQRASAAEPTNFEILDTLAEVHYRRDEYDEAIEVGRRALTLDPDSSYLKDQLARFESRGDVD